MGIEEVDGYGKCLVMEWIDGVTLEEWLQQHHSKAERVHIANQLLVVWSMYTPAGGASRPETSRT